MRTGYAAMRGCQGTTCDLARVGLRKPALFAGCLIVGLALTSTAASAHVEMVRQLQRLRRSIADSGGVHADFFSVFHAVPHAALSRLRSRTDSARREHLATRGWSC